VQDEITRYGPLVLALLAVSMLIGKYPGYVGLPEKRVRSTLLTFNAAFVLFVALDLASGRALTSMTDLPKAALVLLTAVFVLLIANIVYLLLRRRAPR
jgi:hypothetical protein